jgi:hypothetical protein
MDETMRKKHIKIAEQTVNDLAMIVRNAIARLMARLTEHTEEGDYA